MSKIVVTGGNRGIGKEIARQLIEQGHHVIITSRNKSNGEAVVSEYADYPGKLEVMGLDVSDEQSIQRFSDQLQNEHGQLDVLINNAGIYIDGSQLTQNIDMDILDKTLKTNLYGPVLLSKLLLPLLEKSKNPRIVNVSSGMGAIGDLTGGYPAYRISKTSLNAFTKNLAAELPAFKINAVCPGWVQTDMGGAGASRTVDRGAETPVWLATAAKIESGKFWRDKKVIPW